MDEWMNGCEWGKTWGSITTLYMLSSRAFG